MYVCPVRGGGVWGGGGGGGTASDCISIEFDPHVNTLYDIFLFLKELKS